jgi:hypothetical protein
VESERLHTQVRDHASASTTAAHRGVVQAAPWEERAAGLPQLQPGLAAATAYALTTSHHTPPCPTDKPVAHMTPQARRLPATAAAVALMLLLSSCFVAPAQAGRALLMEELLGSSVRGALRSLQVRATREKGTWAFHLGPPNSLCR